MRQLILTNRGIIPLSEVVVGDEVIGKNKKGEKCINIVTAIDEFFTGKRGTKNWIVINKNLKFADQQSIYVNGSLRHAFQVKVGDFLEGVRGNKVAVKSIEVISDTRTKRKLHIDAKRNWFDKLFGRKKNSEHTFYLNGVLVHNANRYWVGDGGNWTGTTHWSASSGGAGGASEPTLSDDALFDANSFTTGSQIITVDTGSDCAALNFTGVTNTPSLKLNEYLFTHGHITFVAGMTTTAGTGHYLQIFGNGSYNINLAGVELFFPITFNDVGTYTLTGNIYGPTVTGLIQKGTVNFNGYAITLNKWDCDGSTTARTLNMGASVITVDIWDPDGSNLTLNANTSTVYVNDFGTFNAYAHTYNIVSLMQQSGVSVGTVSNLVFRSGSIVTGITGTITTLTLYEDVEFRINGYSVTNLTLTKTAGAYGGPTVFTYNVTVTGTFTANGLSQTDRLFVMGKRYYDQFRGTPVVITAAAVSMSNVDFQLITGAGAGTWSGTSIGNAGGNSGITFTNAVTRYWVGNGGNWEDTTHWSSSSGGSSGATMPLPQDNVVIDAASFSSAGQTITVNTYLLPAFDSSAIDNNPTFLLNNTNGNIWMVGATVRLGALTPDGAGQILQPSPYTGNDMTFYSGGLTLPWAIYSNGIGTGVFKLGDDMVLDPNNGDLEVVSGYFDMNDKNLTTPFFFGNWDCFADIDLGTGTLTLNTVGSCNVDFESTSRPHILHAAESRIVFANDGMTDVNFEGGKYVFNEVIFEFDGTEIFLSDGFQVNDLLFLGDVDTIFFEEYCHFLIRDMKILSSLGNEIEFRSSSTGNPAFLICPEGRINVDYLTVQDIIALSGPISDTGYQLPAATGSCDEGTTQNWANTSNIVSSNNSYSTVTMDTANNGDWSDEILGNDYDFSAIPDAAILLGMAVKIEGKVDIAGSPLAIWPYTEASAGLGGCDFDEPSPMGPCEFTTSDAEYEFGSVIHVWNTNYGVSDVKDSNFGAGIDMIQNDFYGSDVVVSIDALSIKVFYIEDDSHANFYFGANSTDVSGNEGIIFDSVVPIKKISGVSYPQIDEVKPYLRSLVKKISGLGDPLASSISDDWAGGSIDSSKWNDWGGAQTNVVSQRLEIASILAGNYVGVDSNIAGKIFDLTNSYVKNELVDAGNQALVSWEVYPILLSLHKHTDWIISIMVSGGNVFARWATGDDSYISAGFAYNAAVHKFFRIRESGGNILYDWSTDGVAWTNFDSQAAPFDVTALIVGQMVGTYAAELSTTTAIFDNFNV